MPQREAPLPHDHGVLAEHLCVVADGPEVLCEGLAVELVLEAVVAVHVEAGVLVPVAGQLPPLGGDLGLRPLKERQEHRHVARGHARLADPVHGGVVEAAEPRQRDGVGRLVADSDAGDAFPRAVPRRHYLQRLQRLPDPPLLVVPRADRPLAPAAGSLATLAAGAAVEVEHQLQTTLLRPVHSLVQILQGRPHVRLPVGRAQDRPVAEGQPHRVEPAAANPLEIALGDVGVSVTSDDLPRACLPLRGAEHLHEVPLAPHLGSALGI
mmetsp:Transcript_27123/g.77848  ORF Transcript_27123/g.77848 Transcript_27123/m.77848 type:complete len:267 (+) Transcript_27123:1041-1841(+)